MKVGNQILKNTGFVFASGIASKVFSFLFIVYAARILGTGNFGIFALIGAVTFLLSYFGNFGISQMAIREIARNKTRAEELFNHIFSLRLCLVILAYPILVFVVNLLGYRQEVKHLIYIAGFSTIFSTFSSSFRILYIAFEKFKVPSLILIIVSFLSSISNIVVLFLGYGLKGVVWISFFGSLLGAIISGIWIRRRFTKYRLVFNISIWKDLISQSIPFAILSFFQQANRYMNIFFLSKLPGAIPEELAMGYYSSPSSICQAALIVPSSFRLAALPTVASNEQNLKLIENIIMGSTKSLLLFVIFPMTLATTFFPREIISIVFGDEYLPAIPALTILGWAYAFQIFNAPVSVTLSASKEIRRFIPWATLGLCINLILAIPLIIYYSFVGAAIAFLVSRIFETVLRNYLLRTIWKIKRLKAREYIREVIIMAIVFSILILAYINSVGSVMLLILTMTLYFISVFSFKDFRQMIFAFIGTKRQSLFGEGKADEEL